MREQSFGLHFVLRDYLQHLQSFKGNMESLAVADGKKWNFGHRFIEVISLVWRRYRANLSGVLLPWSAYIADRLNGEQKAHIMPTSLVCFSICFLFLYKNIRPTYAHLRYSANVYRLAIQAYIAPKSASEQCPHRKFYERAQLTNTCRNVMIRILVSVEPLPRRT